MSGTEKRLRRLSLFLLVSGIILVGAALHSGYVLGVHFDETGTSGFLTSATIAALVLGAAQAVGRVGQLADSVCHLRPQRLGQVVSDAGPGDHQGSLDAGGGGAST